MRVHIIYSEKYNSRIYENVEHRESEIRNLIKKKKKRKKREALSKNKDMWK